MRSLAVKLFTGPYTVNTKNSILAFTADLFRENTGYSMDFSSVAKLPDATKIISKFITFFEYRLLKNYIQELIDSIGGNF